MTAKLEAMIEPSNEKIEVFLENMWTSQGEMNT
jgi:hypothetical protein